MSVKRRKPAAEACIEDGAILIRVPLANIPGAVQYSEYPAKVTDPDVFAKAVCNALNEETETGTTPIHRLLDAAFLAAIESGAEGADLPETCKVCECLFMPGTKCPAGCREEEGE